MKLRHTTVQDKETDSAENPFQHTKNFYSKLTDFNSRSVDKSLFACRCAYCHWFYLSMHARDRSLSQKSSKAKVLYLIF